MTYSSLLLTPLRGALRQVPVILLCPALWCAAACLAQPASDAPATAAPAHVSISFVGDILLADTPGRLVRKGVDPLAPFDPILRSVDIRVANLECVVATTGSPEPRKPWTFRAHPRTLTMLRRHIDAVSLANNHSGDYGPIAFAEMLTLLQRQHIGYFGGGMDLAHAHAPLIIERNGLRLALLGYNEFFPRSFEADFDKPGIAWSEDEQVERDIALARSRYHADIVIPMMHWGWEHEIDASARQRDLAHRMIDAGADAVIGSHPHVTQNIESYHDKPIFYSLGNFVFDGFSSPINNTGWMVRLDLDLQGVRAWRTVVAHIDHNGVPYPGTGDEGLCWQRGQTAQTTCAQ